MIIEMSRARILGPRKELQAVLERVQDLGLVHFVEPRKDADLTDLEFTPRQARYLRSLERIRDDTEAALALLPTAAAGRDASRTSVALDLPDAARVARHTRRALEALDEQRQSLEEERALLLKFQPFFSVFRRILSSGVELEGVRVVYLVVRAGRQEEISLLRASLQQLLGDGFELMGKISTDAESAMILVIPERTADRAEAILSEAGVDQLPLPDAYQQDSLRETMRAMQERLRKLPAELTDLKREFKRIERERGRELSWIQAAVHDHLATVQTMDRAAVTPRAFVLEGWIPAAAIKDLETRLARTFEGRVEVETLSKEEWEGEPVPVVLSNPRLFRPFEAITKMMPLPRYGTIDPTPAVAMFFPMFFGIALGDIGYGMILGLITLILRLRSKPDTTMRSVSEIGLACSAFTVIFGFLYGELFGDLGHKFGLRPIIFNREEAMVPFLTLAISIGFVHVLLGLVFGAIRSVQGERKKAVGRGIAAVMVILIGVALMAAVGVLPDAFFTPVVIALLVAFPILVIVEGVVAPIEFISLIGNILSYARIMAVGTASVMMAVVANRMAGAFGGVVVGVLFALLFHLVNFVLGVFSPTIHMLRLHYVEFFGKFYSPGGQEYRPLRHFSPRQDAV